MKELRVCIDVADLDRAIEFYTRALGLEVGRRLDAAWVELVGGPVAIDLLAEPAGSGPTPRSAAVRDYARHWTPVHLDVMVDDLDAALGRAIDAGAVLDREVQTRPYGRMANLADPFGNGLCLIELRGGGYDALVAR
jgi:catechol 2,3-dioxygenase-like lactoylglutathione lyase family enzyme